MTLTNHSIKKLRMVLAACAVLIIIGFLPKQSIAQTDVYVDIAATGANNGTSWANAYTDLNTAIADADAGTGAYNIYAAQGTYFATAATLTCNPNPTVTYTATDYVFAIKRGNIKLYGGYATGGASRNVFANATILNANFKYHAVIICNVNSTDSIVMDGFKIINGSNYTGLGSGNITVNGSQAYMAQGGGVNMTNNYTTPIAFRSMVFMSNTGGYGGGVFSFNSNCSFLNCMFRQNVTAGSVGGGICAQNSTLSVTQCVFSENRADGYFQASGGGLFVNGNTIATVYNSTFSNNSAPGSAGNGYSVLQDAGPGSLTIRNCIMWAAGDATKNMTLNGNYDITYSDVRQPSAPITGTGNINLDPLFMNASDPDGANNIFGTADDGLQLGGSSPAREVGNNADVPASLTQDFAGSGRIFPAVVDMGAYEGGVTASHNCLFPDLNLFASSGGVTYSWTGPNSFTSSLQNPVITNSTSANAGVYTITITSAAGFTSTATTTVVFSNWYQDADLDGYGNPAVIINTCSQPAGYVANNTDCDDADNTVNNANQLWYMDADGDHYYIGSGVASCHSPGAGYSAIGILGGNDCNDNNAAVYTPATATITGTTAMCHGVSKNLTITCTGTGPFSGTLSTGASFSGATSPIIVSVSPAATTIYTITTFADNVNGCTPVISGSATITVTGIPPTTTGGSTTGPGTVNLSASGAGILDWYDDPTAGNLVNTGTAYSPFITATQTFYVSNTEGGTSTATIGKTATGLGPQTPSNQGLLFNVTSNCTLSSVTVWPVTSGSGFIEWRTSANSLITSVPYTVTAGEINAPKVVTLNLSLTPGSYRLVKGFGGSLLKYDNTGNAYPYTAAGCPVSITGSTATPSLYFFFYSWQIAVNTLCVSSRTPVTATYNSNNITWYLDADNDGWDAGTQVAGTSPGAGWTDTQPANGSGDCDDNNNTIYPGATEVLCNSIDENCNGMADDGVQSTAPTSATSDATFNEICSGNTVNLTVNGGSLGTGASWNWYSGSCTGASAGTGSSISVSPTSTTTYYVKATGACGTPACVQISIAVKTAPPSANVIVPPITNLPAYGCNGTAVSNINVPAVTSATQYIWDGPSGTMFNGSGNPYTSATPSANIVFGNPSGSGYHIGVQAANACGVSLRKTQWVRNNVCVPAAVVPATADLITYCPNSTANFSCPAVVAATSYLWTITGDATVVPSGNNVTVNFGPAWINGTLSVSALTPCYTSPAKSLLLGTGGAVTAYSPVGVVSVCVGATQTYSVPSNVNIASYSWTLPANSSGSSSTDAINVSFLTGFIAGNICIQATTVCGVQLTQKCKSLTTAAPGTPSSITGSSNGMCGQTGTYICPAQAGATYNWTYPAGAGGSSTNNSISITFAGSGFTTGNVCVNAENSCGTSANRCITVKGAPNAPGIITATPSSWCAPSSGIEFLSNVSGLGGSFNLTWSWVPATRATYVIGQGTNDLVVDWVNPGATTMLLTASNACGSGTRTLAVNPAACRMAGASSMPVTDVEQAQGITVYPNPASDVMTIEFTATAGAMQTILLLQDLTGKIVSSQSISSTEGFNQHAMDVSKIAKGIYLLNVMNDNETKKVKVVIN